MDRFRISATGRAPNYLPEFVAADLGFFAHEDLLVERWVPSPWDGVLDDLASGRADAVLGGIWAPIMYHGRGRQLVTFAQLNARFPMALVTRLPQAAFSWQSLEGMTVLTPGAGGAAPYLFVAGALRQAGIDLARITFVHDLSTDMFVELFAGGTGDALLVDAFTAATLVKRGVGHAAARLEEVGPRMPNSVYYTYAQHLEHEDQPAWRFTRALQRAMSWIQGHPAADLRELLRHHWPDADQTILAGVIDDFRASGLWADTVRVGESAYQTWHDMLRQGGLVSHNVPFADIIDVRPAEAALRSLAASSSARG